MKNSYKGLSKVVTIKDDFYLALPINATWHNFFSGLDVEKESKCEEIFIKKYLKEEEIKNFLNQIHDRIK